MAEKANVLLVPIEALQEKDGKKYVTLAARENAASAGNTRREVQVGLNNETYVEIISGLNEGDQVVVPTAQKSTTSSTQTKSSAPMPGLGGSPGTTTRTIMEDTMIKICNCNVTNSAP